MNEQVPLSQLLEEYSQTLLTEEFRLRIRARELANLFPFSIHNIYRVLMAIAMPFYKGFALLDKQLDLNDSQIQELLGPPCRVFRYFHVVLVGACRPNILALDQHIVTLQSLSGPIVSRLTAQLSIPETNLSDAEHYFDEPLADKQKVITLAVYLREYVDYLFLGQHDRGFISYPPVQTPRGVLVLRRFYALPTTIIPWSAIDIYTCYDPQVYDELHYDRFRGDIERLPSPTHLRFATAIFPEESRLLTIPEIQKILDTIEQELIQVKIRWSNINYREVEQELSVMFSTELLHLLEYIGQDVEAWRQHIKQSVAYIHNNLDRKEYGIVCEDFCFTDTYLAQLKIAVDSIRGKVENE